MPRAKKPGKSPGNKKDEPSRIRFELEENAEELFLSHLQEFKPDKRDAEEPEKAQKRAAKPRQVNAVQEIDLHGLRLVEAQQRVRDVLDGLIEMAGTHKLKIITGKGHHSKKGGSVLAKEMHSFVLLTYSRSILEIEESPDQVQLAGVLLRGHFHVTIVGKKSGSQGKRR